MTSFWRFIMCWWLLASCADAQPAASSAPSSLSAPTYLKQRRFFLPYQIQPSSRLLDRVAKVQLLVSRSGPSDWTTLEEAEPNVQGFSYHAPEDGEYYFAIRHLDRRGRAWPSAEIQPQSRIVIDTQQPELTLEGSQDTNGEIVFRYEARDANLDVSTLVLEVRAAGNAWTPVRPDEPDVSQPNRLVGRARWRPPTENPQSEVRASITDRAGHQAQALEQLSTRSSLPAIEGPQLRSAASAATSRSRLASLPSAERSQELTNPFVSQELTNPFAATKPANTAKLPTHDWPTSNQLPARPRTISNSADQQTPPQTNPYSLANTGANFDNHRSRLSNPTNSLSVRPADRSGGLQKLQITPLGPESPPELLDSTPWPTTKADDSQPQAVWSSPATKSNAGAMIVNSKTFDIEYDLQSIGPWGVSKVELWGTQNNGQSWRSFAVDPDNRSPVRVTVPNAGQFGFRILVDGANSAGAVPPQPGDTPELIVSVDLQPPAARLVGTQLGAGNQADRLLVSWTASDSNLEARPIALFYSSYPNGPWSTIASGLENSGSYTWRIERHVPARFYLRLEARDTAGNVTTYQTASPVELARPQPTGRLRSVRPITGN